LKTPGSLLILLPLLFLLHSAAANQPQETGSEIPIVVTEKSQVESPDIDQKGSVRLKYTVMPDGTRL